MTVIPYSVTRARGCINSCYTPDDGCKKCPKHVEWSRSEIKVTAQLHRVGLFNTLRTGDADLRFYITTVQDG